jgi:hypothetical protein
VKLTKAQNPFNVKISQVWKAGGRSKGTIIDFAKTDYGIMAVVQYSKHGHVTRTTRINILNFARYVRVK